MPDITKMADSRSDEALPKAIIRKKRVTSPFEKRRFSAEDFFLALIIVASLAAAVALALPLRAPPAVVAAFLAIAVSTLVYRFLGGISSQTTLVLKTVQITGSLAALVVLYLLFNSNLENWLEHQRDVQVKSMFSSEEVGGTWVQTYPEKGWRAEYTFTPVGNNAFSVTGGVKHVTETSAATILQVVDGQATLTDSGMDVSLTLKGIDGGGFAGQTLLWKTTAPLLRQRATRGTWKVSYVDSKGKNHGEERWGLTFAKME
jgi:hypothetical protein